MTTRDEIETAGAGDLRAIAYTALLTPSPLERYLARPPRRVERDGLFLIASDEAGPDGHLAVVTRPVSLERVLAVAGSFFDDAYGIVVDVDRAPELSDALEAASWSLDEEEPALVLTPIPESPPAPLGLEIRRVATERELDDFFTVTRTPRRYIPSLAAALDPGVALFVGYVEGAPVATARLTCLGRVGEVLGVATLDAFRRRGIGTAMTWAAVEEARRRGCTAVTLSATEMGLPIYRRMGFLHACTLRTYLPPEVAGSPA